MKLFVFLDYYLPGYRAGGPPRTLFNMVERLSDEVEFWIFTRNHDLADPTPYPNVLADQWSKFGRAHVYYASPKSCSLTHIRRIVLDAAPDAMYANSFFSRLTMKYLILRRLGLLPSVRLILAPRGEFSPGAIRIRAPKKRTFLALARAGRLYQGIFWHASSTLEQAHILKIMGPHCHVQVAPNIPAPLEAAGGSSQRAPKVSGKVRFVFISRISEMKNILQAVTLLAAIKGEIEFDIYGPMEDKIYWRKCSAAISQMPPNVKVQHKGMLDPSEILNVFSKYHFFLFPTFGENFGHVIFESLSAGCPVIISDQTPWRQLAEKRAGWDLSLQALDLWRVTLQQCAAMEEAPYSQYARGARGLAEAFSSNKAIVEQNLALLTGAPPPPVASDQSHTYSDLWITRNSQ